MKKLASSGDLVKDDTVDGESVDVNLMYAGPVSVDGVVLGLLYGGCTPERVVLGVCGVVLVFTGGCMTVGRVVLVFVDQYGVESVDGDSVDGFKLRHKVLCFQMHQQVRPVLPKIFVHPAQARQATRQASTFVWVISEQNISLQVSSLRTQGSVVLDVQPAKKINSQFWNILKIKGINTHCI